MPGRHRLAIAHRSHARRPPVGVHALGREAQRVVEALLGRELSPADRQSQGDRPGFEPQVRGEADALDVVDGLDLVRLREQEYANSARAQPASGCRCRAWCGRGSRRPPGRGPGRRRPGRGDSPADPDPRARTARPWPPARSARREPARGEPCAAKWPAAGDRSGHRRAPSRAGSGAATGGDSSACPAAGAEGADPRGRVERALVQSAGDLGCRPQTGRVGHGRSDAGRAAASGGSRFGRSRGRRSRIGGSRAQAGPGDGDDDEGGIGDEGGDEDDDDGLIWHRGLPVSDARAPYRRGRRRDDRMPPARTNCRCRSATRLAVQSVSVRSGAESRHAIDAVLDSPAGRPPQSDGKEEPTTP